MTEPSPSSNNVSNTPLPQPTLATGLAEDDDEPPSSNQRSFINQSHVQSQPNAEMTGEKEKLELEHNDQTITNTNTRPMPTLPPVSASGTVPKMTQRRAPNRQRSGASKRMAPTRMERLKALITPNDTTITGDLMPLPTYTQSLLAAVRYTPLNTFLLFIPVSWGLHYSHQSDTLIFVFSALGIVPLAALLGFGTEQIALRTSSSVGGLLNATLGNVVELIIAGIALQRCELDLVQSSLLGGLLSNLLFVLGMAFVVGGYRFHQQEFQPMVAQLNSSLMTVAVIALIIPSAFHEYLGDRLPQGTELDVLLELSRGSAIILILIYIAYLYFQFYSHKSMFEDVSQTSFSSSSSISTRSVPSSASSLSTIELPRMNFVSAVLLLVATTALAFVTSENLVSSLEGVVETHPEVSKEWLTLIIIPIISNAAEHVTAVVVASKGKFDLAMSVAVGSCIQIALFVIPFLVILAWGMGKNLTLYFDELETLVLFFSVLLVKFSVEDGKSHWLSGVVFVAVYTLIALSFWHFPVTQPVHAEHVVTNRGVSNLDFRAKSYMVERKSCPSSNEAMTINALPRENSWKTANFKRVGAQKTGKCRHSFSYGCHVEWLQILPQLTEITPPALVNIAKDSALPPTTRRHASSAGDTSSNAYCVAIAGSKTRPHIHLACNMARSTRRAESGVGCFTFSIYAVEISVPLAVPRVFFSRKGIKELKLSHSTLTLSLTSSFPADRKAQDVWTCDLDNFLTTTRNMMDDVLISQLPPAILRSSLRALIAQGSAMQRIFVEHVRRRLAESPPKLPGPSELFLGNAPIYAEFLASTRCMFSSKMAQESLPYLTHFLKSILESGVKWCPNDSLELAFEKACGDIVQAVQALKESRPNPTEELGTRLHDLQTALEKCEKYCTNQGLCYPFTRARLQVDDVLSLTFPESAEPLAQTPPNQSRNGSPLPSKFLVKPDPKSTRHIEYVYLGKLKAPRLFNGLWQMSSPAWGSASSNKQELALTQLVKKGFIATDMADHYMTAVCRKYGIKLLTYGSFCGGFLSDKWLGRDAPDIYSESEQLTPSQRKYFDMILTWGSWSHFQTLLLTLSSIASKHRVDLANIAVRWVLERPSVGAVIVGTRLGVSSNADSNLKAFQLQGGEGEGEGGVRLDEEDCKRLEEVALGLSSGVSGLSEAGEGRLGSRTKMVFEKLGDCGHEYR
ncbi:hypothetical protein D9758_010887 [Tetrapyrgos nigripes]|uniref:Uncharacterized protein n=1 Tax=Tetrapyrgos nigripes TaxID=182062 RepID=A0A8H5CVZ6_9AGAR|nr:hypothetical protein D9758_010887 [Tetrapyrgos nigripes]